jgi:hypothetical protein
MMKYILFYLALLAFDELNAQTIYCLETERIGSDYENILIQISNKGRKKVVIDNYGSGWYVMGEKHIISADILQISKTSLSSNEKEDIYYNPQGSILEISGNDDYCFFSEVKNELYRFDSIELKRINLSNNHVENLALPDSLNFLNINVSPNGGLISFVHYSAPVNPMPKIYYLFVYDFLKDKLLTIDSADNQNNEWFGRVDYGPVATWIDNENLLYFRKDKNSPNGRIYHFNICNGSKQLSIDVPEPRIRCFAYQDGRYYFLENGKTIYSVDKKGTRKVWYESEGSKYLQQRLIVE